MKTISRWKTERAFNLIEVLVVVVVIVVVLAALVLLHGDPGKQKVQSVVCMNNLQQTSIAFTLWSNEHKGGLPWQVTPAKRGTMDLAGGVSSYLSALTNFGLPRSVLRCPADQARQPADIAGFSDQNISYFINLDVVRLGATNASRSILAGDRNLQVNGKPVNPGLLVVAPGTDLAWTREFHRIGGKTGGNLAFMDGHAARSSDLRLHDAVQSQGATNRFLFP